MARKTAGRGFAGITARVREGCRGGMAGRIRARSTKLQRAGWKLVEWRDLLCPFGAAMRLRVSRRSIRWQRMTRDVAALSSRPRRVTDDLYRGLEPARALAAWMEQASSLLGQAAGARDYDALEGRLLKARSGFERVRGRRVRANTGGPRGSRGSFWRSARNWCGGSTNSGCGRMRIWRRGCAQKCKDYFEEYEQRKRRLGKLDFVDLLCRVRDLLRDQLDVRHYLQNHFSHLFVDEFQDTDPLQVDILMLFGGGRPRRQAVSWWAIPSSRFTNSGVLIWWSTRG